MHIKFNELAAVAAAKQKHARQLTIVKATDNRYGNTEAGSGAGREADDENA